MDMCLYTLKYLYDYRRRELLYKKDLCIGRENPSSHQNHYIRGHFNPIALGRPKLYTILAFATAIGLILHRETIMKLQELFFLVKAA